MRLNDLLDVVRFVEYLRSPERTRPVAVLTVGKGEAGPYVAVDDVVKQAQGQADIVTIATDDLTRSFSDKVAPGAGAYRGACRVYPAGIGWEQDPYSVPLRMAQTPEQIRELPRLLLGDLRRAIERRVTPPPARVPEPRTEPAPEVRAGVPARIETEADAKALADYLLNPSRRQPVVVVSRAVGATEATADVEKLREDLTGLADVCEIVTLAASWAFSHVVPPMCQVYGGAGRVYPVGDAWLKDPYVSPLRLAYDFAGRADLTRRLVSDTMSLASRGTYATRVARPGERTVTAEVVGVVAGQGLAKLEGESTMGVLWPELVQADLPAERLFAKGMTVRGTFDPDSHRIDVQGMRQDPLAAVGSYKPDDTILVRVATVTPTTCTVELFPGLTVPIPAGDITGDPEPDLRGLMSTGETLPALVVAYDADTREWLLSLADAREADAAVPAPAILPGGPPWLVPPEPAPAPAPAPTATRVARDLQAVEGDSDVARELRLEIEQLAGRLQQANQVNLDLQDQLKAAKTQRREGQRRSRADRAANERTQAENDRHLFLDESEQFDFEVRLAWARLIPPSDKANWPLRRWTYGPDFFTTLRETQGVSREKVVAVAVDVLTGRDVDLVSRERHQLRTGPGGDDAPRVRNNGQDKAMRVSIQVGTPSARRLHYWQCADGLIELASVRPHDDYRT